MQGEGEEDTEVAEWLFWGKVGDEGSAGCAKGAGVGLPVEDSTFPSVEGKVAPSAE